MTQRERAKRDKREEAVEEGGHSKKARQPLYDQFKVPDEGIVLDTGFAVEPSADGYAALLSSVHSDEKRASLATQLQQNYGNDYVQRVVGLIQTKKTEALLQEESDLASIERRITGEKGTGQRLEPKTRSEMEAAFNQDFGPVCIHTDADAAKLARELGAKAFTAGKDIFFREGAYQPTPESGKGLLAHELTHVVQQEEGRAQVLEGIGGDSALRSKLEEEAQVAGSEAGVIPHMGLSRQTRIPLVQLQPDAGSPEEAKEPREKILAEAISALKKGKFKGAVDKTTALLEAILTKTLKDDTYISFPWYLEVLDRDIESLDQDRVFSDYADHLNDKIQDVIARTDGKINRFTRDMLVTVGNINNSARYINKQGYATGNSMTMMRLVDWLQKKPRPNVYSYLIKWKE